MIAEFELMITYGQLIVEANILPICGLLWTDEHVAQGFAWSPKIVAFRVPDHNGICRVQVCRSKSQPVLTDCLWALKVPFVFESESILVGAVDNDKNIPIEPSCYQLFFESFVIPEDDIAYLLRLTFIQNQNPTFEIVKKGGEISTDVVLRRDAELA